jgi:XRE family aerobic/anaerobic benzoate catabolism transcriptional regulator
MPPPYCRILADLAHTPEMRRDPDPQLTSDAPANGANGTPGERDPYLTQLGERIRSLRASRGMSRKDLARGAGVSERYLANLETGTGNASVLLLRQVAHALDVPLPVVLAEVDGLNGQQATEFAQMVQWLAQLPATELGRVREACRHALAPAESRDARHRRIALIGLRGAGKSTLGKRLAQALEVPFVELNAEIERVAGCGLNEIHNLLGPAAYRRYERRALEEAVQLYPDAVIATPGGLISDPATFNLLLAHCYTVWLKAAPEEHMQRVIAQGDLRPMAGNREAMDDLKRILAGRAAFYGKADATVDTSARTEDEAFEGLLSTVQQART